MLDQADAATLIVRQDVVPAAVINDCIDSLQGCRAEFLGHILNDVNTLRSSTPTYGYGKYGYGNSKYGNYGFGSQDQDNGAQDQDSSSTDSQEK